MNYPPPTIAPAAAALPTRMRALFRMLGPHIEPGADTWHYAYRRNPHRALCGTKLRRAHVADPSTSGRPCEACINRAWAVGRQGRA